jgi:hypothetical protein
MIEQLKGKEKTKRLNHGEHGEHGENNVDR